MSTPNRSARLNALFTPDEAQEVEDLADKLRMKKGAVMRYAVHQLALMTMQNVPTCANGRACFVPQMHAQQVQVQIPTQMSLGAPDEPVATS